MSRAKNKKRPVGRPRIRSEQERRANALKYQLAWRKAHPEAWSKIWKRHRAKLKAQREGGVHVELDLSALP